MNRRIIFKHTSFLVLVKDEVSFSKKLINHINKQHIKAEFVIADGSKIKQKNVFDKLIQKKNIIILVRIKTYLIFLIKLSKL